MGLVSLFFLKEEWSKSFVTNFRTQKVWNRPCYRKDSWSSTSRLTHSVRRKKIWRRHYKLRLNSSKNRYTCKKF